MPDKNTPGQGGGNLGEKSIPFGSLRPAQSPQGQGSQQSGTSGQSSGNQSGSSQQGNQSSNG